MSASQTIEVGSFPKNAREEVRVCLVTDERWPCCLDVRIWETPERGRPRMTSKGFRLSADHTGSIAKLLIEAERKARDLGFLDAVAARRREQ